jgi:hypothetical protein
MPDIHPAQLQQRAADKLHRPSRRFKQFKNLSADPVA